MDIILMVGASAVLLFLVGLLIVDNWKVEENKEVEEIKEIEEDRVSFEGKSFRISKFKNNFHNGHMAITDHRYGSGVALYYVSYSYDDNGLIKPALLLRIHRSHGATAINRLYPLCEKGFNAHEDGSKFEIKACDKAKEIIIGAFNKKKHKFPKISPPVAEMAKLIKQEHKIVRLRGDFLNGKGLIIKIMDWESRFNECLNLLQSANSKLKLENHELEFIYRFVKPLVDKKIEKAKKAYRIKVSEYLGFDFVFFLELEDKIAEDYVYKSEVFGGKVEVIVNETYEDIHFCWGSERACIKRELTVLINGKEVDMLDNSHILNKVYEFKKLRDKEESDKVRAEMTNKLQRVIQEEGL